VSPAHLSVFNTIELFSSSSFLGKVWIEHCNLAEPYHDQGHTEERLGCTRNTLAQAMKSSVVELLAFHHIWKKKFEGYVRDGKL